MHKDFFNFSQAKAGGDDVRFSASSGAPLPQLYSNTSIMSTLGIRPAGPCHFPLAGWAEFARLIQPLIERHHYGKVN